MTIEEYERKIREETDASIASQARNNAAAAEALASTIGNAAQATAQQTSGGVGEAPEWETQQQRQQNQEAVNNAVQQTTTTLNFQDEPQKAAESKPLETKEGKHPALQLMPYEIVDTPSDSKEPPVRLMPYEIADAPSDSKEPPVRLLSQEATDTTSSEPPKQVNVNEGEGQTAETPIPSDADLKKAEADLMRANADYVKGIAKANKQQNKAFADMVQDYYNEKQNREAEMRRQEQANMFSSMGSSFAELGAGLANLFYVGTGASNQHYKSYTQDWMRKADQDIRDHRRQRNDMAATLQRLKLQQAQVKAAGAVDEMKAKQGAAKDAYDAAKRAYDREWETKKYNDTRADKEWQKGITEQDVELKKQAQKSAEKSADARIAQGWETINNAKRQQDLNMRLYGFIPDDNDPSGYRYDPSQAAKGTRSKSSSSGSSSGGGLEIPLMAHGNLPAETIRVKDEKTLEAVIFANIDAVTDLTMMQKDVVKNLLEDDTMDADKKARELRRYLVSSGQLRSLFKAEGVQEKADAEDGWLFRQYGGQ